MKKRGTAGGVGRFLRRCTAGVLALLGLWMAAGTAGLSPPGLFRPAAAVQIEEGDEPVPFLQRLLLGESALLAQWAADAGREAKPEETSPEEADEEQNLEAVTPDKVEERTISGSGAGYVNGGGISLFNRTEKTVDLAAVAAAGTSLSFRPADQGPQVLIIHTHGTESFARDGTEPYTETGTAHTTDSSYNIIRVGDEIARIFEEQGISVLHDTEFYDYPSYNGAYDRSRAAIEGYLAQYPTIQMVLDVHRDALVGSSGEVYKLVSQEAGNKVAQVMLVVGSSGAGADHPRWKDNLAFAVKLQQGLVRGYDSLARPIVLRGSRYNQQLSPGSLLVEVGGHGNTLSEAIAGARLWADNVARTLLAMKGEQ